jgi:hypothetical protein
VFWTKRSNSNESSIAVVTSDGRTVADGNLSFETDEVKELLQAIRDSGPFLRHGQRSPRHRRGSRRGLSA